jgi:hypothetical protein
MIVAERKPLAQIEAMLADCRKILLVGCGTCTAVCLTGGEKEVELLAAELRMRAGLTGRERFVDEITLTRQCDKEYVEQLARTSGITTRCFPPPAARACSFWPNASTTGRCCPRSIRCSSARPRARASGPNAAPPAPTACST